MKNILITGGSSGLGLELAKLYSTDHHVLIIGRDTKKLERASSLIKSMGHHCDYFKCDITIFEDIQNLCRFVDNKYKTVDVLINNAGSGYFGPFNKLTEYQLDSMFNLNVKGTILITQQLLPYITEKIINIISTAGLRGKVNEAAYVASKFAVRGFTESLQLEYKNILNITAVYMGGMNTPFWHDSTHIKDKSRLKNPQLVAEEIFNQDDGRDKIIID